MIRQWEVGDGDGLEFWVDEDWNRWDKRFFTKEQAENESRTMNGCFGCLNCHDLEFCRRCSDCSHMNGCDDCMSCVRLKNCRICVMCSDCESCVDLYDCSYCIGIEGEINVTD